MTSYTYASNRPLDATDPLGLLEVLIWHQTKGRGGDAFGHAAIQLDNGRYISWWPNEDRTAKISDVSPLNNVYRAPAYPDRLYRDDASAEGRPPDARIRIDGLDERAIEQWWDDFRRNNDWATFGWNCSSVVSQALNVGNGYVDYGYPGAITPAAAEAKARLFQRFLGPRGR